MTDDQIIDEIMRDTEGLGPRLVAKVALRLSKQLVAERCAEIAEERANDRSKAGYDASLVAKDIMLQIRKEFL